MWHGLRPPQRLEFMLPQHFELLKGLRLIVIGRFPRNRGLVNPNYVEQGAQEWSC